MKKRLIGLALSAALGAGLPVSPSLALEPLHTMFDDVPVGEWYTTGVTTCANEGIMIGDGNGLFRPEDKLTKAECGVLALRLHELLHGGDGTLEKAPEDWGELTLTLADGTVLTGFGREVAPLPGVAGGSFAFDWWSWGMMGHVTANNLQVALRPDPALDREGEGYSAAQEALSQWGKAHEGAATVTAGDVTIPGAVNCWRPTGTWALAFHPDEGTDGAEEILHASLYAPDRDCWWRDADHYRFQQGLDIHFFDGQEVSTRAYFARCLALAAGELPAAVAVDDIPDVDRESDPEIYMLYEAGVLNGMDGKGTFAGESSLTRAQAATMAARVLDPDQRVAGDVPTPLPADG